MIVETLTPIALTLANRIRGGLFGDAIRKLVPFYGTTAARILYGVAIAVPMLLMTGNPVLSLVLILTTYLGHSALGFSPYQYMEESTDLKDMTIRGVILTGFSAIAVLATIGIAASVMMTLLGLAMGPTYYIMQKELTNLTVDERNEVAELAYGLLTGVVVVIVGSM